MREPAGAVSVSTLELFFDLVFVFAITQLTAGVVAHPNVPGVARAGLVLGVLWWMYGGYAWLTNAVPPRGGATRVLLLVGMAGFFVVALSIPDAFDSDGLAFGLGYLLVNAVHTVLFLKSSEDRTVRAVLRLAPFNAVTAGLLVAAGFVHGTADWVLWGTAFALQWVTPYLTRISGFTINSAHFVERHGLVVLIALGESVVAVGIGAVGRPVSVRLVVAALLGLALSIALWWTFFDGDDERAERAMEATEPRQRPHLAITAFGYSFLPLLGGIVLLAAGVKKAVPHIDQPLGTAGAWFLAAGIGAYLVGEASFRSRLGIGPALPRAAAGVVALASVPLGTHLSAQAQMAALLALLVALIVLEPAPVAAPVPQ